MLHVRGSYDQELIFGSISAAGQVSGGMWQSMAKKIMADLGGGGQQWTTIGNNGQQWIRIDNININIRGATCISDAVLQQQQKGPRQVISFHKQN